MRRGHALLVLLAASRLACSTTPSPRGPAVEADAEPSTPSCSVPLPDDPSPDPSTLGPAAPSLLVSNALQGYLEPCGCTLDVVRGGIERIAGYACRARQLGPILAIDTGNALFDSRSLGADELVQGKHKAALVADLLRAIEVRSTTPGPYDLALGLATYRELTAGLPITVANAHDPQGQVLGESWRILELDGGDGQHYRLGLSAVIDPGLGLPELVVDDPFEALQSVDAALDAEAPEARLLIVQGDAAFAASLEPALGDFDLVWIAGQTSEDDATARQGERVLFQGDAYGRQLAVLKLWPQAERPWFDARSGSADAIARLERRIAHIDDALDQISPKEQGSDFVAQQRAQLASLRRERLDLASAGVSPSPSQASFAYFAIPVDAAMPVEPTMLAAKDAYHASLRELALSLDLAVTPLGEGEAGYVGAAACLECHEEAHALWAESPHAHAWQTLVDDGTDANPDCVSCHLTGYAEPGGSILGKIDGLEGVQCEACHGPGSIHVAAEGPEPPGPGQVWLSVPEERCRDCHDPENSPRFVDAVYRPHILGEGHEARLSDVDH